MSKADINPAIRAEISEVIAWSLFRGSQEELERMIESHHSMTIYPLSLEEREAICEAWTIIEENLIRT